MDNVEKRISIFEERYKNFLKKQPGTKVFSISSPLGRSENYPYVFIGCRFEEYLLETPKGSTDNINLKTHKNNNGEDFIIFYSEYGLNLESWKSSSLIRQKFPEILI